MPTNPPKGQASTSRKHLARQQREQRQTRIIVGVAAVVLVLVVAVIAYGIINEKYLRWQRAVVVVNGERISVNQWRAFTKYYRNNVMHIFALPALLASFFQNASRISRAQILSYSEALYPYLRAELFMRWEVDELAAVIDQWLAAFVEQGLLRVDGESYVRPAPSSRQFVLLTLLSRVIVQTLQRFYMATSLLLNSGQHSLSAEELENLCTVMAQRLSILHGLNAPEFFDKSLFRHFIQGLLEQNVLSADASGKLGYHDDLGEVAEGVAKRVLPAELRLSIRQVALERHEDEVTPQPDADQRD